VAETSTPSPVKKLSDDNEKFSFFRNMTDARDRHDKSTGKVRHFQIPVAGSSQLHPGRKFHTRVCSFTPRYVVSHPGM
jgi:hypothetical protein